MMTTPRLSPLQQVSLVVLRTLVGWHFLYEGYTKLLHPAWSQGGAPVPPWSSAAYLKAATGPLAPVFHWMGSASWIGSLDLAIAVALTAVGVSLMLGLFTQTWMRRRAGAAGEPSIWRLFPPAASTFAPKGPISSSTRTWWRRAPCSCCSRFAPARSQEWICLWMRSRPATVTVQGGSGMNLTPEQMELGRRNFLKVLAGTPAMAALGAAAALRGPAPGGRVRLAFIGVGSQGRAQLTNVDPDYGDVRALCDINPAQLKVADEVLAKNGMPPSAALRRLARDAAEGGCRSRHHGPAAVGPRGSRRRLSRGGQARAVREDDGVGRGRLRAHARGGAAQ